MGFFATLRTMVNGTWLIAGDMNEIIQPSKVSNGSFLLSRSLLFNDAVDFCNFIDMPAVGDLFTWRKNTTNGGHVRKCLHKCMADMDWRIKFPHALVELLNHRYSDHNPLLISCHNTCSYKNMYFHFQVAWLSHPQYAQVVTQDSIKFNIGVFGNIFRKKQQTEGRLKSIHRQLDLCYSLDLVLF